jgi:hypothetical protein
MKGKPAPGIPGKSFVEEGVTKASRVRQTGILMRTSLFLLVLALGSPLPFVSASLSLEEDAVVESARSARRPSAVDRRKARVLPSPAPRVAAPPLPAAIPVLLRPAPEIDLERIGSRPPPAI